MQLILPRRNSHFQGVRARVLGRYGKANTSGLASDWVANNTTLRGRPFSFIDHEFQIMPLNDTNPRLATEKCAQVGWTEIFLRWALYHAVVYQGFTTIFTQPNKMDAENFSKSRGRDAIEQCKPAQEMCSRGDIDSAGVKKIGLSYLYFRGTIGKSSAISVPSDANVHDEVNFSSPNTKNMFKSRLQHSSWAYERDISTPTIPKYGVSASYNDSDKKRILWRCDACGDWQRITFPDSIYFRLDRMWKPGADTEVLEHAKLLRMRGEDVDATYRCKCGAKITKADNWEWVAERPGAEKWAGGVSGYAMSQLDVKWRGPWDIVCASDERLKGYKRYADFVNFVLGAPHLGAKDGLTEANFTGLFLKSEPQRLNAYGTFGGIDIGKVCHATFFEPRRTEDLVIRHFKFPMESIDAVVKDCIDTLHPIGISLDAMPYEMEVNRLIKAHPEICHKVRYNSKNFAYDENNNEIKASRTPSIDIVVDKIRNKTYRFCGENEELIKHFENIARIQEEDPEEGTIEFTWVNTGPDHFVHSMVLAELSHQLAEFKVDPKRRVGMPTVTGVKTSLCG